MYASNHMATIIDKQVRNKQVYYIYTKFRLFLFLCVSSAYTLMSGNSFNFDEYVPK
jgi:hypothetical protein